MWLAHSRRLCARGESRLAVHLPSDALKTPGLASAQHLQRRARMSVCAGMVSAPDFVAAMIRRNEEHPSASLLDLFVHNLADHAAPEHDAALGPLSMSGSRDEHSAERHERPTVSVLMLTRDALLARELPLNTGRHT